MKKLLFLIAVLCVQNIAAQEKWEYLTKTNDSTVFIDISTMSGDSQSKQMWFKYVPQNRVKYIRKKKLVKNYSHSLTLISFNCGEKTYRIKQSVAYSTKGDVISTSGFEPLTDIVPGSGLSEVYPLLCSK